LHTVKMLEAVKPMPLLQRSLGKQVRVLLKDGMAYEGVLMECDSFMNVVLDNVTEYDGNGRTAGYGRVLIRGNNIVYVVINHL
jgi:small nuclear ribonucleoprotein